MEIKMTNKLDPVSMNGRMAYVIMCVEAYLTNKYAGRDWTIISRKMWSATSMNWADWSDMFSSVIPDVLLQYREYSVEEFDSTLSEKEYRLLKELYEGITEGNEADPDDELNYILNKPFEMATVYEGTIIGDGKESFEIIDETEKILLRNGIDLPDYKKVLFSSVAELNGWGNDFNGERLSVIIG